MHFFDAAARSDPDLVAGLTAGRLEDLRELYNRYFPTAYALALRMLTDTPLAEACVHAVFLDLWGSGQPAEAARNNFAAWLLGGVHATARARQRGTAPCPAPVDRSGNGSGDRAEPAVDRANAARLLAARHEQAHTALASLLPLEREVLELAYFDGLTVAEIATACQEPLATIYTCLNSGMQRLCAARVVTPDHGQPVGMPSQAGPVDASRAATRSVASEMGVEYRATVRQAPALPPVPAPALPDPGSAALSTISEISERRRLDQQQDQLLMLIAHELKTPITVIKGNIQMAGRNLRAAGHLAEAKLLDRADTQVDRLTSLIEYLLRASQFDTGAIHLHTAPVDLADLVREIGIAMELLSATHRIVVESPAHLVIEGDADRLEQLLRNLITNAIKYSPAGGAVEITLRSVAQEVELCVRDYGIGIPATDREQVFERGHRADNVGDTPGFGLGLFMCLEIARAHHGRIWVDDVPTVAGAAPSGSLLCLTVPLRQPSPR